MNPLESNPCSHPLLVVVSGPSGVGKDHVLAALKCRSSSGNLAVITTNTTRAMRPGEIQDSDYHFISLEEFQNLISSGGLLEYANVYGNWYGVPRAPVRQAMESGRDVIIKVDVQGAKTIKKSVPGALLIFLIPSSMAELAERLRKRNTERADDLERRLKTAESEMQEMPHFDYVIVNANGLANRVIDGIEAIMTAEKLRVHPEECRI
jgi:guanylate kinase